jgi:hypothetical protein
MQIEFLEANNKLWIVKRRFPADSWFTKAVETYGGEAICKEYCVERVLRDANGVHYLVNEVSDAEIVND